MRIKEIGISRLFGLFNHEIPMKMSDRVTIITGPNGYGKTTILRLVDSLIGGRYAEVRRVPFRDFRITFEDGRTIQVVRVDAPRPANRVQGGADLMISLLRGEKKEDQATISAPPREALNVSISMLERAFPNLVRSGLRHVPVRSGASPAIARPLRLRLCRHAGTRAPARERARTGKPGAGDAIAKTGGGEKACPAGAGSVLGRRDITTSMSGASESSWKSCATSIAIR